MRATVVIALWLELWIQQPAPSSTSVTTSSQLSASLGGEEEEEEEEATARLTEPQVAS